MRHILLFSMFLILVLSTSATYADRMSIPANERELLPSTPPGPDCNWEPFESKELGLRMLVQQCPKANKKYQFYSKNNQIIAKETFDNKQKISDKVLIEFFYKLSDQSIRDVISDQFVSQLNPEAQKNCQVKNTRDRLFLLSEQVTINIIPSGDYALKIDEEVKNGRKDYGCGEYGANIADDRYFIYHPNEDLEKFLFIHVPENKSLFDENSIILYPTNTTKSTKEAQSLLSNENKLSSQLELFYEDRTSILFFDTKSNQLITPNKLSIRVLTNFVSNTMAKNSHLLIDGASKLETITFDCLEKKYKSEGGNWFKEKMAEGNVVKSFNATEIWSPIPSFYKKLFTNSCNKILGGHLDERQSIKN